MATGRQSRLSPPPLAASTTPSLSNPPHPLITTTTTTTTTSPPLTRHQPNSSSQQQSVSSSLGLGDPSVRISTASGSSALSRSASTALRDDLSDPPRPLKRPRLHSPDLDKQMKFESLTEPSELHESNGTSNSNVKNGIIKETTNGVSSSVVGNGAVKNGSRVNDQFFGHSREEVTRLIIQSLNDLGYKYASLPLATCS